LRLRAKVEVEKKMGQSWRAAGGRERVLGVLGPLSTEHGRPHESLEGTESKEYRSGVMGRANGTEEEGRGESARAGGRAGG